ncbi:hypothetical protein EDB85DRAFT_2271128, partial [Lactarius pseudohatsudake]
MKPCKPNLKNPDGDHELFRTLTVFLALISRYVWVPGASSASDTVDTSTAIAARERCSTEYRTNGNVKLPEGTNHRTWIWAVLYTRKHPIRAGGTGVAGLIRGCVDRPNDPARHLRFASLDDSSWVPLRCAARVQVANGNGIPLPFQKTGA